MSTKGPKLKIQSFDVHGDRLDMGKRFEKWIERFERDMEYNGCSPDDVANAKKAQMAPLIYAGNDVEDLHDTLPDPIKPEETADAEWTAYMKSKTKLLNYFSPRKCNDYALFEMMQLKPESGEGASQYATKLRKAGDKCDFSNWNVDKMIKSLMIANMPDEELRLKFLQKEHTLDEIIDTCQRKEDALARSKIMHGSGNSAKKVKHQQKYQQKRDQPKGKPQDETKKSDANSCPRCGYANHENQNQCPANGRTCNFCKKQGHFSSVCFKKQKPVKQVEEKTADDSTDTDSSDDEYACKVEGIKKVSGKTTLMRVMTNDVEVLWQPDTGATKDIWDEIQLKNYERSSKSKVNLQPTNVQLYAYGSKKSLTVLGKFEAKLKAGEYSTLATIYVTKESSSYPLLSETTSERLNLVKYNEEFMVKKIGGTPEKFNAEGMRPEIASMIRENKEVFSGKIGRSKTRQVKIMIDDTIKPVVQKPRRIPYNLMDKAEAKLETLLKQDIIESLPMTSQEHGSVPL